MHTTRSYFFPSPRKYPSYLPQTILLLSWNGSSFVNDSNGDSFMASSLPFLLVSCTPRVASADERWNHGVVRISLARVKESQNERERGRESEFQGWRRTILSPLTQFMADHSTLALSLSLSSLHIFVFPTYLLSFYIDMCTRINATYNRAHCRACNVCAEIYRHPWRT